MKTKLTLLFTLLTLCVSGVWADSVTITSGGDDWTDHGSWTASYNDNWATDWTSTNGKIVLHETAGGGIKKADGTMGDRTYTIYTPGTEMITGFSITFTKSSAKAADKTTITYATGSSAESTGESDTKTLNVTGLFAHFVTFNITPGWAAVTDFSVTYTSMPAQTAVGYYLIKANWPADNYLYAYSNSDNRLWKSEAIVDNSKLNLNNNYVWKVTSYGSYRVIQNVGTGRYISNFNTADKTTTSRSGGNLLATTDESDAEVFSLTDRSAVMTGAYAYKAGSKPTNCWLNTYSSSTNLVGFHNATHQGDPFLQIQLHLVTFNKDTGTELKKLFTSGAITASDLEDYYDYSIGGVAKTKDEVVTAINAVTDDNLVVVCSYKRNATISSKAEVDPTKVYTITMKRDGEDKAKWMYAKAADATVKSYFSTNTLNTFDDNNLWAFVSVDGGDNYYLYNVGKKRFVMSKIGGANFMDAKFTMRPITLYAHANNNASYPLGIKDGNYVFNENSGNLIVDNWTTPDDGNRFSIQPLEGYVFDPSEAQAAINAMESNIPFHTSPAPSAGSFDVATTWYNISMRPGDGNGGYYAYVPAAYDYESPSNISLESSTGTKSEDDKYRWCITGSVDEGYRLYNKAAGADKVFVFDGGGKMKSYTGNETTSLFYLAPANISNGIGAPTFVFKNTDSRPNKQGNPPTMATWSNSDIGSEFGFVIDEAYTENNFYYIEYVQTVKPFMDDALSTNYFHLTSAKQKENIWNAPTRYSDGVEHAFYSHDDVTAMRTTLEAYLKKPIGSIAVRLKNNKTDKYVSYGTPTWNAAGLICNEAYSIAETDFSSVLQFIPATASTYYIYVPSMDKYIGQQRSGNTSFPLVEEASRDQFTLIPTNTPGVIYIYSAASAVDGNYQGYLHSAGWSLPGVVNWQSSAETSAWNIEDAETICFDMISPTAVSDGEDVYMTYVNRLGLPLKAPADASVWIISSQDAEKAYMSEVDSKEIPTGNGVIIKAEKGSSVHMSIKTSTTEGLDGNVLVPGDGTTTVAGGNFMLAYNSTDEIAKFYAIGASGFVVPANKAYLPAMGGGVKALVLSFDDDPDSINTIQMNDEESGNAIYNLAGQRLNKMQKGINIVNGKKVLK